MPNARITELRSIELGVPDLDRSSDFYQAVWGLQQVVSDGDTVHLRGTCAEHHVVTLRQRPRAALLGVHFSASDRNAITELHAKAKAYGTDGLTAPAELERTAGGGYGFRFNTPDGLPLAISADVIQHPDVVTDRSRPTKLTHVVLNSARIDAHARAVGHFRIPFDDHRKQNDTIHNRMVRVRRSGISSSNTENDRNPRRERSRGSGIVKCRPAAAFIQGRELSGTCCSTGIVRMLSRQVEKQKIMAWPSSLPMRRPPT